MVTVLPDKIGKTIIILSCLKDDRQGEFYLNKLFSLKQEEEFERALISIIIGSGENTYLNPSMWGQLGDKQKILKDELNSKKPIERIEYKPFQSELNFFSKEFSTTI